MGQGSAVLGDGLALLGYVVAKVHKGRAVRYGVDLTLRGDDLNATQRALSVQKDDHIAWPGLHEATWREV